MAQVRTIHLEDWPVVPVGVPGSLVVWRKRLAEARERGEFTDNDIQNLRGWNTCAVGEYLGFPATSDEAFDIAYGSITLRQLGCDAKTQAERRNFDRFESILSQLEALKEKENPS